MALLNVYFYCFDCQLTVYNCMAVSSSSDQLISHITLVVTSFGFSLYQHPNTHTRYYPQAVSIAFKLNFTYLHCYSNSVASLILLQHMCSYASFSIKSCFNFKVNNNKKNMCSRQLKLYTYIWLNKRFYMLAALQHYYVT